MTLDVWDYVFFQDAPFPKTDIKRETLEWVNIINVLLNYYKRLAQELDNTSRCVVITGRYC